MNYPRSLFWANAVLLAFNIFFAWHGHVINFFCAGTNIACMYFLHPIAERPE